MLRARGSRDLGRAVRTPRFLIGTTAFLVGLFAVSDPTPVTAQDEDDDGRSAHRRGEFSGSAGGELDPYFVEIHIPFGQSSAPDVIVLFRAKLMPVPVDGSHRFDSEGVEHEEDVDVHIGQDRVKGEFTIVADTVVACAHALPLARIGKCFTIFSTTKCGVSDFNGSECELLDTLTLKSPLLLDGKSRSHPSSTQKEVLPSIALDSALNTREEVAPVVCIAQKYQCPLLLYSVARTCIR